MPTSEEFVKKCLEEVGDQYEFGAEVAPGTSASASTQWDCSELVEVKLRELGIDAPDGSSNQLRWVLEHGTQIPLAEGMQTRGALLLRDGHVAVSLGGGQTIEAKGEAYGVNVFSSANRGFTHAGRVPGLSYDGQPAGGGTVALPDPLKKPADRRPTLRNGSVGGSVRFLQKRLIARGFDPGAPDGAFGPRTDAAVRAFQRAKGLLVDGVVGLETWAALSRS